MSKVLAIDVGEKRVGFAVSDENKKFAFARETLEVENGFSKNLEQIITEEDIEKIVVGLPRNMDGTLGPQADKVKSFVGKHMSQYQSLVVYEDETATSILAEEELRREGLDPRENKGLVDSYAAKIILESWLNDIELKD